MARIGSLMHTPRVAGATTNKVSMRLNRASWCVEGLVLKRRAMSLSPSMATPATSPRSVHMTSRLVAMPRRTRDAKNMAVMMSHLSNQSVSATTVQMARTTAMLTRVIVI